MQKGAKYDKKQQNIKYFDKKGCIIQAEAEKTYNIFICGCRNPVKNRAAAPVCFTGVMTRADIG